MNKHSCVIVQRKPTDYLAGALPFVVNIPSGNWQSCLPDFDSQKIGFETDACVPFSAVESVETQMNFLIRNNLLPDPHLLFLKTSGFIEPDGQFHASERFIAKVDGTNENGTAMTGPWDAMRKFGLLPWADWPYDETITSWEEFYAPIPQNLLDKAKQFLTYFSFSYAWIDQDSGAANGGTDVSAISTHLQQAPLCIGTPVCEPWDQIQPPVCHGQPFAHSTMAYREYPAGTCVLDHYDPFEKLLASGYEIPYVLKGLVTVVPPIPAPLPQNNQAVSVQTQNWLQQAMAWVMAHLLNYGSYGAVPENQKVAIDKIFSAMFDYSILKSKTFWTTVVLVAYNFFTAIIPVFPNVSWLGTFVNILGLILVTVFHVSGVKSAALASAGGSPRSGQ